MRTSSAPSTSKHSPTIIPKRAKKQKFGSICYRNKNHIVFLPKYGYSTEVIVGDPAQNCSTSEDEFSKLEKALYSSNANANAQSLAPKMSKNRPAKKQKKKRIPIVQVKDADKTGVEETPDLLLDSWDAYLQLVNPELFDKDFRLPDTSTTT